MNKPVPTISTIRQQIEQRKEYARELIDFCLARINEDNAFLNVFISKTIAHDPESLEKYLEQTDPALPLFGIPVAVKDNIAVSDLPMTAGSKMLKTFICPYDATVVRRLRNAGAWIIGKTNMDEFAMGSSNEFSAFGPVRNPRNTDYVPGGSSGGSCAAVASDMAPLALGSDTGGSIRQPSSYCGVVGIRPTYGLVSRYGLCAFSSSLDQIGPVAHSVDDAFLLLSVIAGHDPLDSQSYHFDYTQLGEGEEIRHFAIIKEIDEIHMQQDVRHSYEQLKSRLSRRYVMKSISLEHFKYALPAYHILCDAEASSNLLRFNGISYGERENAPDYYTSVLKARTRHFGTEVKRRILLGTYSLAQHPSHSLYQSALNARFLISEELEHILHDVSFILTPTTVSPAFRFGEKLDPMAMYYSDICTIPSSLAGLPSVSLPYGVSSEGLPLGMQLTGARFSEKLLHRVALMVENSHAI